MLVLQLIILKGSIAIAEPSLKSELYLKGLKNEKDLDKFIQKNGLQTKKHQKVKNINVISVELNQIEMRNLQGDTDVAFVELDSRVEIASKRKVDKNAASVTEMQPDEQTIPWGITDIGVNSALENNILGKKIKIAVLDTGIGDHEDLKIAGATSFVEGVVSYKDDNGHGTHVAGTIAAGGNGGSEKGTTLYPAKYPEVIAVGAVDKNHVRANFSSTGSELDLVAPGVDILSTTADGDYGVLTGTSMAGYRMG